MSTTSKELSYLLQYFSVQNSSNRMISLALTVNDSFIAGSKQQTFALGRPVWDLLDVENSSTSSFFNQYDNISFAVQYGTNYSFSNRTTAGGAKQRSSTEIPIWLIPCYSIILIFAIAGNLLVASTLFRNRRMRTITNVFLANLAISDILLGVLCMPITLVGTYLRHFIFGELVCKFIQFAQAASVAVSSWTLVAISCERYYAICHPLRSRTWQTINHAYKIIGCIWCGSIICMAPIAIFSQLIPTSRQGLRKCREQWPEEAVSYERFYNIFLDLALLVLPLAILCVAYILITRTLYMGIKDEKALIYGSKKNVSNSGKCDSSGARGETKIYTQVEAEMKSPSIFHLNMSFRYHTRKKGAPSGSVESNVFAGCIYNSDSTKMLTEETNKDKEIKNFSNTGLERKHSAMGAISSSAAPSVYPRRGLAYNSLANAQPETEVSLKEITEQLNSQKTQSSLHRHYNDDITLISSCHSDGTEQPTTTAMVAAKETNKSPPLTCTLIDGRCKQLYCMRSTSIKSLSQNCIESRQNVHNASTSKSCFSLNAIPTAYLTRNHQRPKNVNQKCLNRPHSQLMQICQEQQTTEFIDKRKLISAPSLRTTESALRRSNLEKNLESKKRVVKMLFVLVLEFFICWTPLYVINTVAMFIGPAIYEYVDYTTISFFQLLAYSSSCCNPITYCFMNASFRRAFVDTFKGLHLNGGTFWHKSTKDETNLSVVGNSIALANSCTVMTANSVLDSPRL